MPTTMITAVANQWAVLLFRGLAALALAVLIEAWPVVNMPTLARLIGAYALVDGLSSLLAGNRSRGMTGSVTLVGEGVVTIAAGFLILFAPYFAPAIIAVWAIFVGSALIAEGTMLRDLLRGEWPAPAVAAMLLVGILSLILGFVLAYPLGASTSIVAGMVTLYALFTGVAEIAVAIRIREHVSAVPGLRL